MPKMFPIVLKWSVISLLISSSLQIANAYGAMNFGLFMLISVLLPLILIVLANLEYRRKNDGVAAFGSLLKLNGIYLVISMIFGSIFTIFIVKFFPNLMDQMLIGQKEWMTSLYELAGMSKAEVRKLIKGFDTVEMKDNVIKSTLINVPLTSIVYLLISMIPSAFIKRDPANA